MERTQIYLSRAQSAALDRAARRSGLTRSHLIRDAIDQVYLAPIANADLLDALDASFGSWANRSESGAAYVDRLRSDDRLAELWGDHWTDDEESDEPTDAPGR